jgi:hypothetical protein
MPRLTNLDEVLFPVEERPIFAHVLEQGVHRQLPIPFRKALVNGTSGQVVGVVSRDYRLVTNREALDMALQCCRAVFPETRPCEWQAKGVDAPSTGGHCRIDLVHNSAALDFSIVPAGLRPEAFGPFIRVTNSYNGLRALGFDIGYYRKVCSNGLIVPGSIIRFRFPHALREIGKAVQFRVARHQLAGFRALLADSVGRLGDYAVQAGHFETLLRAILKVRLPRRLEAGSVEATEWSALRAHLGQVCERYAGELGENVYALFNAITDVASHPPSNRCLHRDRHGMQQLAGAWLTAFNAACPKPGFSVVRQVREFAQTRSRAERSRAARVVEMAGAS